MILACHNLNKAFGEHTIVCDGSFHIEDREKAALVGINGAGKSTILKMIIGEEPLDGGDVILAKGKTLGYLAQRQDLTSGNTIYEEVKSAKADIFAMEAQIRSIEHELKHLEGEELQSRLETYNRLQSEFDARNGYACESEITGVLKGLGFTEDDFNKQTDTLSGGQKTRVSLGKLLLTSPDILLLDEPTNHLDLNSIAWLETYLINYSGAVFIVSHDRYFLNRVVTKVVEIDNAQVRMYLGNYKDYAMKKQQIRDAQLKEYMNQQREIKHQEEVIEKFSKFGSPYIGHPNNKLPGIEMNSGSLGHGLPVCVGMALAGKKDNRDYRVYTVMGDGELAEGSVWEGFMAGHQYKLDNLCAVIDRNRLQISGNTEDVMGHDDLHERIRSFGWHVIDVKDGNDIDQLNAAFEEAKTVKGKPTAVIANTVKGCGSSVMENKANWHHKVPTQEEYDQIIADFAARKEAALHE